MIEAADGGRLTVTADGDRWRLEAVLPLVRSEAEGGAVRMNA